MYVDQPISLRSGRAHISYVKNRKDLAGLRESVRAWQTAVGKKATPKKSDALAFARLAMQRWSNQFTDNRTADHVERILEFKQDNSYIEVGVLAVATWNRNDSVIGICGFRCTWPSNIAVDYLVVDPVLEDETPSPIDGLGTGLIQHVCAVANHIGANAVWGETTQNSVNFYRRITGSQEVDDLIILKRKEYLEFLRQLWSLKKGAKRTRKNKS
jgi:N-acetylglutamate synthase-like GNAT family acetyltransferase